MGKSTISMAIFNSYFGITRGYVKEREGNNRLRSISTHPPFAGVQVWSRWDLQFSLTLPVTTPTIEKYFQWWYSIIVVFHIKFPSFPTFQSVFGGLQPFTRKPQPSAPRREGDSWPVPSDILPAVGRAESRRWSFGDAPLRQRRNGWQVKRCPG